MVKSDQRNLLGSEFEQRKSSFSESQRLFIEYLSFPFSKETLTELSKRIGVTEETLLNWKADPAVIQAVSNRSLTMNKAELPRLLKMLLNRALNEDDIPACKLFIQQLDKIEDMPELGLTVDEVLRMINNMAMSADSAQSEAGDE